MKLNFACPTSYLKSLDEYQDFYLLLPHEINKSDNTKSFYIDFFKENSKYKVMDNSASELGKSVNFREVVETAHKLNCQEVVLPDILYSKEETMKSTEKALEMLHKDGYLSEFKWQAVAQGTNSEEYLNCLSWLLSLEEVSVIGLAFRVVEKSFHIDTGENEVEPNRKYLTETLDMWKTKGNKEFHLLGLGNVRELSYQKKYSWIRSCDSTKIVRYALADILFKEVDGCPDRLETPRMDFDTPFDRVSLNNIKYNIDITRRFISLNSPF